MTDRPTDDDIARRLRDDDAAPPPHLDARIRAAAREAAADAAADAAPQRRWRLPVGLAAAASVMLAVLVVRQAPEPAFDPVTEPAPAAAQRVAPGAEDAAAREERAVGASRTHALRAPAPTSPPPAAQAAEAEAKASADAGQDAAELDGSMFADVAAGCAGTLIDLPGHQVCASSEAIEVRSPEHCPGSASVPAPQGAVTARADAEAAAVVLMVDGVDRWRVECTNDRWTITPADDG